MKRHKFIGLFFLLSFFIQKNYSQKIELGNNISFEIEKIKYKKTTQGGQGWVFSPKGYKYLILEIIYHTNNGEKNNFLLSEMNLKTDKEKYKVRPYSTASIEDVKNYIAYP